MCYLFDKFLPALQQLLCPDQVLSTDGTPPGALDCWLVQQPLPLHLPYLFLCMSVDTDTRHIHTQESRRSKNPQFSQATHYLDTFMKALFWWYEVIHRKPLVIRWRLWLRFQVIPQTNTKRRVASNVYMYETASPTRDSPQHSGYQ